MINQYFKRLLGGVAFCMAFGFMQSVSAQDIAPDALAIARQVLAPFGDRVTLVHADYRELERVLDAQGVSSVAGVLADFGVDELVPFLKKRGVS